MDILHEEIDDLNEETFGSAEAGDWELEHEKFALAQTEDEHLAPDANELPRFWESAGDVSFLWHPGALNSYKSFLDDGEKERGVDVEETLQKLVSEDEAFDDPAILDISKKAAEQKLCGSALEKILGAPAYPTASISILGDGRDIWSSINRGSGFKPTPSNCDTLSLLQQLTRSPQTYTRIPYTSAYSAHESRQQPPVQSRLTNLSDGSWHFPFPPPIFQNKSDKLSSTTRPKSPEHNYLMNHNHGISVVPPVPCFIRKMEQHVSATRLASNNLSTQIPVLGHEFAQPPPAPNNSLLCSNPLSSVNLRTAALPFLMMTAQNAKLTQDLLNSRLLPSFASPNMHASLTPVPPFNLFAQSVNAPSYFSPSFMQAFNSSLRFFAPQTVSPLRTSFGTQPRTLLSLTPTSKVETNYGSPSVDSYSDEPFDPDTGSWMTQRQTFGVLLMYLRPLMVSNPYIQDYYFAVHWLRQMTQNRVKQLSNGTLPQGCPPPVMNMPSPVTVEDLIDPSQYCRTSLSRRFVVPLVSLPSLHRCLSPQTSTQTETADGCGSSPTDAPKFPPPCDSSPIPSQSTHPETGSVLGRPTKASLNYPRVVAEVSLSSALAESYTDSIQVGHKTPNEDCSIDIARSTQLRSDSSTKRARRRLLLMARIERMYSLVLHIDEIDVSLARVVVENDTRSKLLHYRQQVLACLLKEFVLASATIKSQSELSCTSPEVPSYMELLSVRKGTHLFSSILLHLPQQPWLHICLSDFLLRFEEVHRTCLSVTEDYHSVLFPNLRRAVYQMKDIEPLMKTCFPEVPRNLEFPVDIKPRTNTLISTKLGISLILCLLDTCARLSKPDDPSTFVRYASYFVYVTTASSALNAAKPIESFPHLASIVPLYVKPDINSPLTCSQVDSFCCLIDYSLKPSTAPNSPLATSTSAVSKETDQPQLVSSNDTASLLHSSRDTVGVHIAPLLAG